MSRPLVSVCGSSGQIEPAVFDTARLLGRLLAQEGISVLCGGRDGVMEAVCQGVSEAEGPERGVSFALLPGESPEDANGFADFVFPSGMGYARNAMIALMGEVVLVVGGASGTLTEAAYAWNYGKPLIALSATGGVAADITGRALDKRRREMISGCDTAEEAVALTKTLLTSMNRL